jgi:GAF domain-containing protein
MKIRGVTIRSQLVLLVLGTVIPVLAFAAVSLIVFNKHSREATGQGLVETARALSVAIDQQVAASTSVLETLAASDQLRRGDLEKFHRTARKVLATQQRWQSIVLLAPDGRQLLNTASPFGAPLPRTADPELIARVARTRAPAVSDLFTGNFSRRLLIAAAVPVVRGGSTVYVLGATFAPTSLTDVLLQQRVPPSAVGTLLDRNKVIIARTREADTFVGQPGTPDLAARMDQTAEGAFRLTTNDGQKLYAAISRSPRTGWTVALGVPKAAADAPLRSSLWLLTIVGATSTLLGILAAVHWARRIANPIASLSAAALALARGDRIDPQSSAFAEVNAVREAMERAGQELQQREAMVSSLAAVGRELLATLDFREVSQRIVDSSRTLLSASTSVLYRLDPETGDLLALASSGEPGADARPVMVLPSGAGVAGLAVRERRASVSADLLADPRILVTPDLRSQVESAGVRAILAVPLLVQGRVLGALGVADRAGRVFDAEDMRIAQAFADQAAIAIENARLYGETQERLVQSETLLAVSQQVSETMDVTEMMRSVAREACRALGADTVGAFLADRDRGSLRPIAGYHVPKHLLADFMTYPIPLKGHRILEEAWAQQRAVASSDVAADPKVDHEILRRFPHRSGLFCPMVVHGEPIGGLFLAWFERERRITAAELRLVEGISRQAGIALANARLVEQLKQRQARLEALLGLGRELSRIQPVETLLARIAEACGRLFDASSVTFRLVEGDDLVLCGTWGPSDETLKSMPLQLSTSLTGLVALTGEPLAVQDPISDPRLDPRQRESFRRLGIRAFLGAPVKIKDQVVGVLTIRSARADGFSPGDVEMAGAFASQAGIALENSQLYQKLQGAFDELSHAQSQLVQAQKMEAIGQLAGGIAHDFNNLLTVIGGRSHLLLKRLPAGEPARRDVELIQKATDRATAMTAQLLAFSRKQVMEPKSLDLNALVEDLAPVLTSLIGADIELVILPGMGLGRVMADPGQMEQVIMNLLVNARDAMTAGGTLRIETDNRDLQAEMAHGQGQIPLGLYVTLTVRDGGCGVDAPTLARMFEPFFTTKGPGKGTGMGLSTVFGIVHQSGGYIGVDSTVGRGTTVTIYLPRTTAPAETAKAQASGAPLARGQATILLVEDEEGVRHLASEILTACGYQVLDTGDPMQALAIGAAHPGTIHLLLTDIVMPGMRGPALATQVLARYPDTRVLYMSGYSDGMFGAQSAVEPAGSLLQKPFTPQALARAVRNALDAAPRPHGSDVRKPAPSTRR